MKITSSSVSQAEWIKAFSLTQPISISLIFFLAVIALRSIDLFVLKLSTWPDPILVSRVLGFLLVLAYVRVMQKAVRSIGLHARNFEKAALVGGVSLIILYTALYSLAFYLRSAAGEAPRLVVGVIDNETGTIGSAFFSLFWLFGQIINALMEEFIFRGILLPQLMRRFRFWKANLIQALLFGLAHLVFPLATWLSGEATPGAALAEAGSLLVFTTMGGLVFGYLYYRTGSLWTAVFAHLIDNSVGIFFHIQTVSTLTAEKDILFLASIGFLSLPILAWIVAKISRLPTLQPWGAD